DPQADDAAIAAAIVALPLQKNPEDFVAVGKVDVCQLALRAAHGLVVDLVALGQQLADLLRVDTADVIVGHEMYLLARFESVRLPATLLILERFGLCRRPSSGGGCHRLWMMVSWNSEPSGRAMTSPQSRVMRPA